MRKLLLGVVVAMLAGVIGASGCTKPEVSTDGDGLHAVVPQVQGEQVDAARPIIEDAGYVVGSVTTETVEGTTAAGVVTSQNPAAGTALPRGGKVDLVVAGGAEMVTVPDAVGFTVVQVRLLMGDFGLVGDIKDFEGNPMEVKVKRQEPAAGTEVEPGSTVTLWTK